MAGSTLAMPFPVRSTNVISKHPGFFELPEVIQMPFAFFLPRLPTALHPSSEIAINSSGSIATVQEGCLRPSVCCSHDPASPNFSNPFSYVSVKRFFSPRFLSNTQILPTSAPTSNMGARIARMNALADWTENRNSKRMLILLVLCIGKCGWGTRFEVRKLQDLVHETGNNL